jgi:hypothetical protein
MMGKKLFLNISLGGQPIYENIKFSNTVEKIVEIQTLIALTLIPIAPKVY